MLLALTLLAPATTRAESSVESPTVGWSGDYLVGRWTQISVPFTNATDTASPVQLEVTAVDCDGNRVVYLSPPEERGPGSHRLTGMIKVGRLDGAINARVLPGNTEFRGIPDHCSWLKSALKPSVRLIVTTGNPQGFDFESEAAKFGAVVKFVSTKVDDLPTKALAYDGVFSLVLAGPLEISEAQSDALREWVSAGGRLVISLSQETASAVKSIRPLKPWLPVSVADSPVTVREFGGLETFSGKPSRVPYTGTLPIPGLKIEVGETLAASRADAFLVRAPYGLGSVSVLALDLTAKPLIDWKSLSPLCARLVGLTPIEESSERTVSRGSQLSSTGITDLATQVHATQEHFEQLNRPTPWFVMSILAALLIAIGPVDYLLVHRLLKKPQLTWVTFPLWIAAFTLLASWSAAAFNGTSRHANQLDILNVDVKTNTIRGRHLFNLYSPETVQTSVSAQTLPCSKSSTDSSIRLCWQGVPESNFGGMVRGDTGFEQGAQYSVEPDGKLSKLPLIQWSSKSLVAESLQSAEGLVTAELTASPTGRLTGTLLHRFSEPIEDWLIVYKSVSYRLLKNKDDPVSLPLPPNQIWRAEQPSVYSRDLRPYLTGILTMGTPRAGMKNVHDPTFERTAYDPLSLDSHGLIRVLTFHEHLGGDRYTGLTNWSFDAEDCSHLLKLGRAILFGELKQPVANILEDQKTIEPDRRRSFVRLIIPVAPPVSQMKELRRVVPD